MHFCGSDSLPSWRTFFYVTLNHYPSVELEFLPGDYGGHILIPGPARRGVPYVMYTIYYIYLHTSIEKYHSLNKSCNNIDYISFSIRKIIS